MRVRFNYANEGYMDSSGQWWNTYHTYNASAALPGVNSTPNTFTNTPAQAISNLPSHRDADIYRGGWYRASSINYTAPVTNGLYTVKLYFTEGGYPARLMDITLEGKLMNPGNPYNAYYYCGNQNWCGNVQMFDVVVTDGNLDIILSANSNAGDTNPRIVAISIKKRI